MQEENKKLWGIVLELKRRLKALELQVRELENSCLPGAERPKAVDMGGRPC